MANKPEQITTAQARELVRDGDTDRLIADPRAIDELNQSVIKEFRANQGKVGGPMEGDARLVTDDDWRQDRPNPGAPTLLLARWRSPRDNRLLRRRAAKSALVS